MRCIATQCRDWYTESMYLAPGVYVYGGLSLCLIHQEIAVAIGATLSSRTVLFAIDNETAGK